MTSSRPPTSAGAPAPGLTTKSARPLFVLSDHEQVTLRRVAYGQSEVRVMRAADLDRLRKLLLIEDGRDGPRLTPAGKHHFDNLPRGVFVTPPRHADHPAADRRDGKRDRDI